MIDATLEEIAPAELGPGTGWLYPGPDEPTADEAGLAGWLDGAADAP
jgi:hypothetical protein